MRFANHDGRLTLLGADAGEDLDGARGIDVHSASGGAIPAGPEQAFAEWDDVVRWASEGGETSQPDVTIDHAKLGPPSPRPNQIFGIGVNYADHGAEAGMERPEIPLVFTKLLPAIAGPYDPIELSTASTDWEIELAVVIGRRTRHIDVADAWSAVAGLTAGQDLSERDIQMRPKATPQFGLGKSLPGFGPIGPVLVTPDTFADRDDLALSCSVNGEEVQSSRTSLLLLSVSDIVAYLSSVTELLPGDVIFTGTPSGVGFTREPPRFLAPGDTLVSTVEGIGTMSHTFVAPGGG